MTETSSFRITSTPLELSQFDRSADSGYQSTYSHTKNESSQFDYSLVSREYVDFLYYLGEKNDYMLIVKKILRFLRDEDLYNAAAVSKTWKRVIISFPTLEKRIRYFSRIIQTSKENRLIGSGGSIKTYEDIRVVQSPRNRLAQIQNFQNSPSSTSPVTRTNFRFEAYQKEGRKLKLGRRLFSCPKCKLPSHVDQKIPNTAECTNSSCQYRFCILCHCEEHHTKMCDFISTPVVRRQSSVLGTTNSKKNLKRLLL